MRPEDTRELDWKAAWLALDHDTRGQKARIAELEAALRPFAEKFLTPDDLGTGGWKTDEDYDQVANDKNVDDMWIERGWIRRAREALRGKVE